MIFFLIKLNIFRVQNLAKNIRIFRYLSLKIKLFKNESAIYQNRIEFNTENLLISFVAIRSKDKSSFETKFFS